MPDRFQGASALRWTAHLLTVGGQPVILSAMTVVPTTLLAKDSGRPPVIVSVVKLDGAMLAAMGRSASLSDLCLIDWTRSGGAASTHRSEERRVGKEGVSTCRDR